MPLQPPVPSGTQPAAVTSADSVASPSALSPAMPIGHSIGDTLLCFTACTSPTPTVSTPSGWTKLVDVTGTHGRLALFARPVVTGSETMGPIVWSDLGTGANGTPVQARIVAFSNLDNSDMAAMVDALSAVTNFTASATSAGGGAITTTSDHGLVLSLTVRQDDLGLGVPSGFTFAAPAMLTTSGADGAMGWAYHVKTEAGSVTAPNFGSSGSSNSSGVTVALKAKPVAVASYSDVILGTSGRIAYWRLGEPSGSFLDSSGNTIHASTVVGAVTRQVAGLIQGDINPAVRGDGAVGTYISAPFSGSLPQLSFECWIKLESFTSGRVIMRRGGSTLSISGTNAFRFSIIDSNANSINIVSSTNTFKVGQRQHVVAVFGGGTTGMKLYVDGVSVGGAPSFTPTSALAADTTNPFNMLASDVGTAGVTGTLDEVAVYNRALTPNEIFEHYEVGRGGFADKPVGSVVFTGSIFEESTAPASYYDTPSATLALSGTTAEQGVRPFLWGAAARELPPLRHHVDAITPTGRHYRWASDEPDAQNVPNGLRWGSSMPGGYETMDCILPRMPGVEYEDLERLSTLRIISNGGKVVGEYRLERTPQVSGEQMSVSPSAVGWQAHLDDHKGVSIVFIDRELGSWVAANSQRRLAQLTSLHDPIDAGSTQGEDGLPSLKLALQGPWARRANCEAYYHFPQGDAAGRVKFDYQAAASINVAGDANWVADMFGVTADGFTAFAQLTPTDWLTAISGSVESSAAALAYASRRALMIRLYHATAGGADNTQYDLFLRSLRVFGDHGLQIRGLSANKEGFIASDMIAHVLRKWCPLINVAPPPPVASAGQPQQPPDTEWIQPTDFIIPQAKFTDTTTGEIIKQLTRFGLEDWGVWNDKTFYLSPRNGSPLARRWRARIGPAKMEETGRQADRLWESIVVQYNDVDGTARTVGPPGSGADVESSYLKDIDPENPANKLGMIRRDKLVMGISTPEAAIEVGRRFLSEQKLLDRSGRATLVGHVEDNHGVLWPYSEVQAGDAITFVDSRDTSYRRIVKADHNEAAKSVSVDLDAPPEGLQAVLERLSVVLAPFGL